MHRSELVELREQSCFHSRRSASRFHIFGETVQVKRHRALVFKFLATSFTALAMLDRLRAQAGIDYLLAGYVVHHVFKSLAIHAKHLADSSSFSGAPSRVRNFSISMVRARCNLDRTVPIAQPSTSAASL